MARPPRRRESSPSAAVSLAAVSAGSNRGSTPGSAAVSSGRGRLSASFLAPSRRTRAVDSFSSRFSARERAADTPKESVTPGAKGCTSSSSLERVASSRWFSSDRVRSSSSRFLAACSATTRDSR